jgi:hypothetical protein
LLKIKKSKRNQKAAVITEKKKEQGLTFGFQKMVEFKEDKEQRKRFMSN